MFEYVPRTQSRQLVFELAAEVVEYFPITQSRQLVGELAATVVEYFPGTQLTHVSVLAKSALAYVPGTQLSADTNVTHAMNANKQQFSFIV